MRCAVGFCPAFPRYGPAVIGAVPRDLLGIVFRNPRHRIPCLGTGMHGILSSLEEEGSFVPSGTPTRPHLGQRPTAGQD